MPGKRARRVRREAARKRPASIRNTGPRRAAHPTRSNALPIWRPGEPATGRRGTGDGHQGTARYAECRTPKRYLMSSSHRRAQCIERVPAGFGGRLRGKGPRPITGSGTSPRSPSCCSMYSRSTAARWRGPVIRRWSRHSRRRVPIEALGDRVRPRCPDWGADDADVGAGEHGVEGGGELAVPVADQEPELLGAVAEVHQQVAGLLGDPGAGGVGGDPGDVHAAAAVLDHDEDVEAAQEDGVDVGEVDREDRVGLRGQELSPGRAGPSRGGVDAGGLEDRPDGGGGDRVAEADQLALDASVAPGGILPGHPQHQGPDGLRDGRSAWLSARVGPAAGDELGVPAQQGSG